jgi:predicted PurR-regulated permease PerM
MRRFDPWELLIRLNIAAGFVLAIAALYLLRDLVMLVGISTLLAMVWMMAASFFQRVTPVRLPRKPVLFFVIITHALLLVLLVVAVLIPAYRQLETFALRLPMIVRDLWMRVQPVLQEIPGFETFDPRDIDIVGMAGNLFQPGIGILGAGLWLTLGFMTVIFLAAFVALNPALYHEGFVRMMPLTRQSATRRLLNQWRFALQLWIKGTAIRMLSSLVLVTVLLHAGGVEYALLFGLAAAVLEIVPFLGPVLATIGPLMAALATSGMQGLWVVAVFIGVAELQRRILIPSSMRKELVLPPALIIVTIFAMASLFGAVGVFLAAPALTLILTGIRQLYGDRVALEPVQESPLAPSVEPSKPPDNDDDASP